MSLSTNDYLYKWNIGSDQVLLSQQREKFILANNRTGQVCELSSAPWETGYAANMIAMFHNTIGKNLTLTELNSSAVIPKFVKKIENSDVWIALFAQSVASNLSPKPLVFAQWGVFNEATQEEHSVEGARDAVVQDYVSRCPTTAREIQPFASTFQAVTREPQANEERRIDLTYCRSWHERSGTSCEQRILTFLNDPSDVASLKTLEQLGLAPAQIQLHYTSTEKEYFQQMLLLLNKAPEDTQARVFKNLENLYPSIFSSLVTYIEGINRQSLGANQYEQLRQKLQERVVGQPYATEQVVNALKAQAHSDALFVFLFPGPSGIGKTETAKAAALMKGTPLLEFNMESFSSPQAAQTFFGSDMGYVGSTDKPFFSKIVDGAVSSSTLNKDNIEEHTITNRVILFDEFEKAHPSLAKAFLTLFREGFCIVKYEGNRKNKVIKYLFKRCLMIGSSNACHQQIMHGFTRNRLTCEQIAAQFPIWSRESNQACDKIDHAVLGRMTVVPFGPISRADWKQLVAYKLPSLVTLLKNQLQCASLQIDNAYQDNLLNALEARLYREGVDIPAVERYFTTTIQNAINKQTLWGPLQDKKLTIASLNSQQITITCDRLLFGRVMESWSINL